MNEDMSSTHNTSQPTTRYGATLAQTISAKTSHGLSIRVINLVNDADWQDGRWTLVSTPNPADDTVISPMGHVYDADAIDRHLRDGSLSAFRTLFAHMAATV